MNQHEGRDSSEEIECRDIAPRTLRLVLGICLLFMLFLSWPLWFGDGAIPRVPFSRVGFGHLSQGRSGVALFLLIAVGLFAASRYWRLGYLASALALGLLILGDQHRFQAWVYQYLMTGLALSAFPWGTGRGFARLWCVSIYIHSGLSKIDVSFRDELGRVFLAALVGPFGIDVDGWPSPLRNAIVLAMPLVEIIVGFALLSVRFRGIGLLGAVAMHAILTLLLGPLGLGHSALVQVWNASMMVQAAILFGPWSEKGGSPTASASPPAPASWLGHLARLVLIAGMFLPLLERQGWFDPWPSHALYASHVERMYIDIHEAGLGGYPETVRKWARPLDEGPWHRLDVTGWSRDLRGSPVYPGNRAGLGLAEGLFARYGDQTPCRVILLGRANRWTGQRSHTELLGLVAIREWAKRYWINGLHEDS